ncbi:MAG: hypothetical protein ACRC0S_01480 [Fusobacteriaceae bacterium]
MNKKSGALLGILIVIVSIFGGYNLYRVSPRTFLDEEKTFIYANENINKKNIDEIIELSETCLNKLDIKLDKENVNKILENVKSIYLISEDSFITSKINFVTIIDPGYRYIFYLSKIKNYFDNVEGYYSLKFSMKEKLNLKKYGIDSLYMIAYKGNFILATNINQLKKIENRNAYSNKEIAKNLDENITKNLGVFILNLEKEKIYDLKTLVIGAEYKDKKLNQSIYFETVQGTKLVEGEMKNRSLDKYISNNTLYIFNSDYNQLKSFIFNIAKKYNTLEFGLNLWQGMLGVKLSDLIDDMDNEIIFNYTENKGIIKIKKSDNFKKILPEIINFIKIPIKIKDNMVYIGEEELKVNIENKYKLKENQFLYLRLEESGNDLIVEGTTEKNGLLFYLEIQDAMLEKYFKKFILGGREQ